MALLASYGFSAGSGATAADSSGNGKDATASGTPWTATGHTGSAAKYSSAAPTDKFTTPRLLGSDVANSAVSFSAWIFVPLTATDSTGADAIIDAALAYTGPYLEVISNADNTSSVLTPFGTPTISNGAWHHVCCTADLTTAKVYVDGVQTNSSANTSGVTLGPALAIATKGSNTSISGITVDDVRIYSHALTAGQVTTDMNTPVGSSTPPTTLVNASLADYEMDYYARRGVPAGSLQSMRYTYQLGPEFPYWAGLSGLTPAGSFSLEDHKRKAMLINLGLADLGLFTAADLAIQYWAK